MNYICQVLVLVSILIHMVFSHPILPATGGATATKTEETEELTTKGYYEQYWEANGWKTDDAGNVYVGDDSSKMLLIQQGSYCPISICKGWFGIW
ncbi:hypothetical protein CRE_18713 [Caenorhabditis remanei]|uniref:Uncharacterized protein n=2 Tax=Caenorhabditis remanei TaxID=31234 RepID=E3LLG2_CAERE|nr:hypothetical protein CRE_18713 [Caenorhabditis remanei]